MQLPTECQGPGWVPFNVHDSFHHHPRLRDEKSKAQEAHRAANFTEHCCLCAVCLEMRASQQSPKRGWSRDVNSRSWGWKALALSPTPCLNTVFTLTSQCHSRLPPSFLLPLCLLWHSGARPGFYTSRVTLSTLLNHHPQGQQCLLQVVRVWHPLTVFPAKQLRLADGWQATHHQSGAEILSSDLSPRSIHPALGTWLWIWGMGEAIKEVSEFPAWGQGPIFHSLSLTWLQLAKRDTGVRVVAWASLAVMKSTPQTVFHQPARAFHQNLTCSHTMACQRGTPGASTSANTATHNHIHHKHAASLHLHTWVPRTHSHHHSQPAHGQAYPHG